MRIFVPRLSPEGILTRKHILIIKVLYTHNTYCIGLLANYYERIEKLIDSVSDCGWGFYDILQDIYSEYRLYIKKGLNQCNL